MKQPRPYPRRVSTRRANPYAMSASLPSWSHMGDHLTEALIGESLAEWDIKVKVVLRQSTAWYALRMAGAVPVWLWACQVGIRDVLPS